MNKVVLVGRIGKDPEGKTLEDGKTVCNFSLATSRKHAGNDVTQWHNIVCWGKTAEAVLKYCKKGALVGVTGEIQYRTWNDKKTNDRKDRTDINADSVDFISKAPGESKSSDQTFGAHDMPASYEKQGLPEELDVPF